MSDNVTPISSHETFDLGEFLGGANYPQETFKVTFDSAIGYDIHKAEEALKDAEADRAAGLIEDEDVHAARLELETLVEKAKSLLFTVTVRAVPRRLRQGEFKKARAKYPVKRDILGNEEANDDFSETFTCADWALHIIEIAAPDGRVLRDFNPDKIAYLRGNSPAYTLDRISRAIDSLYQGSQEGFEYASQGSDFLSVASPED